MEVEVRSEAAVDVEEASVLEFGFEEDDALKDVVLIAPPC